MEVSFDKGGRKMTLIGEKKSRACKMISGRKLHKMLKNKWGQLSQLFSLVAVGESSLVAREEELVTRLSGEVRMTITSQP